MQLFNDIANERFKNEPLNDGDNDTGIRKSARELRNDAQNEVLADELRAKLGEPNRLPFLAVGYSGIPRDTIYRHLATACEKGASPVRLFMYLIKQEPLWRDYQSKKVQRNRDGRQTV